MPQQHIFNTDNRCIHCGIPGDYRSEKGAFISYCSGGADAPDMVNHPPHYTSHPSGIECIQITRHMSYNIGSAIAYLWRSEYKNGIEDLEKSIWHIKDEIERLKNVKK